MANRPEPLHQMTDAEFEAMFPAGDDEAPRHYLKARRWPNGVVCPRCGNTKVYELKVRPWNWQCHQCANKGYRFSLIAGTVFGSTNKPLRQWFQIVRLMLISKKRINALEIQRQMGFGSYQTSWSMCRKIRAALIDPQERLGGIVEVDDTWVRAVYDNRHGGKRRRGRGRVGLPKIKGREFSNPTCPAEGRTKATQVLSAVADKHAANVLPIIADIKRAGASTLREIADALNARGVSTPHGTRWYPTSVANVLARANTGVQL
jgi:transposase-like protein